MHYHGNTITKTIHITDVVIQQEIVHGKIRNGAQQKLIVITDFILGLMGIGTIIGDIVMIYV